MASRKLTGLSGKQVLRALQRGGFELLRVKGSHHILWLPGNSRRRIIVPVHGTKGLPPGTLRSIIEQSGLSMDEFIALL